MINMLLFAAISIIGGSFCTSRALKQMDKLIKEGLE